MANEPNMGAALNTQPGQSAVPAPQAPGTGQQPVVPVAPNEPDKGTPGPTLKEGGLPAGTSDRTKDEFDKLKQSNKQLFEANQILQRELQEKARLERTFEPIKQTQILTPGAGQQAQPPTGSPQINVNDFVEVDPETGDKYINDAKLQATIKSVQERASRAERTVQNYIARQQANDDASQRTEAFTAHPELNPEGDKFDANISRKTRSILLDSMMNPQDYGGRQLRFREAADMVLADLSKSTTGQPATPVSAVDDKSKVKEENQERKEQASLEASSNSGGQYQPESLRPEVELSELQKRTRKGDVWALARRLVNTPHTGTPTSSTK